MNLQKELVMITAEMNW